MKIGKLYCLFLYFLTIICNTKINLASDSKSNSTNPNFSTNETISKLSELDDLSFNYKNIYENIEKDYSSSKNTDETEKEGNDLKSSWNNYKKDSLENNYTVNIDTYLNQFNQGKTFIPSYYDSNGKIQINDFNEKIILYTNNIDDSKYFKFQSIGFLCLIEREEDLLYKCSIINKIINIFKSLKEEEQIKSKFISYLSEKRISIKYHLNSNNLEVKNYIESQFNRFQENQKNIFLKFLELKNLNALNLVSKIIILSLFI